MSIIYTTRNCHFYLVISLIVLCFCALGRARIIIFDGGDYIEEFPDTMLPFSQHVSNYGLEGALITANPPDACSMISKPPDSNFSMNWFVLIEGNLCDYNTKVIHSELAGYSAAVIYNFRGRNSSYSRHWHGIIPNISAVSIRTTYGVILKENYLYTIDTRYRVYILPNNTSNIMAFLLLLSISAGIFIAVVLLFLVIRCVQARACPPVSHDLSTRDLRNLQISTFRKGDPYETCAICLEDYKSRDKLRILTCLHGYHAKCIDPWLKRSNLLCPVCKKIVVLEQRVYENSNNSDTGSRNERSPLLNSYNRSVSFNSYRAVADNSDISSNNIHPSSHVEAMPQVSADFNENSTPTSSQIQNNYHC